MYLSTVYFCGHLLTTIILNTLFVPSWISKLPFFDLHKKNMILETQVSWHVVKIPLPIPNVIFKCFCLEKKVHISKAMRFERTIDRGQDSFHPGNKLMPWRYCQLFRIKRYLSQILKVYSAEENEKEPDSGELSAILLFV